MKNNSLQFLLLSLLIASCGGGGGGSSLELTVQQFSSFSVDEDDTFQTVISASTNKSATIDFAKRSAPKLVCGISLARFPRDNCAP